MAGEGTGWLAPRRRASSGFRDSFGRELTVSSRGADHWAYSVLQTVQIYAQWLGAPHGSAEPCGFGG